jgi:hypothetical protein
MVYRGLVPISPNTTPSAASVSAESLVLLPVVDDIKKEVLLVGIAIINQVKY